MQNNLSRKLVTKKALASKKTFLQQTKKYEPITDLLYLNCVLFQELEP